MMVTTRMTGKKLVRALPALLAVAGLMLAAATADAGIQHRYSFNADVATGGTVEDLVGNADGVLLNGAFTSGGLMTLAGGSGQGADHLNLLAAGANGINIATYSNLTVEIWATHNTNDSNTWSRYFDFGSHNFNDSDPDPGVETLSEGNLAGNSIFLTADAGGGANAQRLAISNVDLNPDPNGGGFSNSQAGFENEQSTTFVGPEAVAAFEHHIVATFDEAANTMTIYLNGVQISQSMTVTHTMSVLQDDGLLAGLTDFALIGAALYPDDGWEGTFNEVRIYDMTVNAANVAQSFARGPDGAVIPEPATALMLLSGLLGMIAVRRRR